jgi:arylsulfatase/arylsulfatase A
MTDDQGYGDFGMAGNPVIRTPHLDSLAAESARLTTFYVSPVCSPTRASLLTGRYNYRTRVVDTWIGRSTMDPEEVTLAEILRDEGYGTGIFGKWHLGDTYPFRPQEQGFEEVLVHRGGGIGQPADPPGSEGKYTDPVLFHNGARVETSGYCTDVYFDYALNWIESARAQEHPFLAYIATNAPHDPLHDVPEDLYEQYRQKDLTSVKFPQTEDYSLPQDAETDRLARVYAMITNIDDNVGRLLNRLDEIGLAENTIVIFLSDNGPAFRRYGSGLRGAKTDVYEGGIRSRFFMRWPARLAEGQISDEVTAHIDLLPTVLDAADIEVPAGLRLDGRSVLPLLTRSGDAWPPRAIVIQSHRGDVPVRYHHFMLREGPWKLVHPSGFGRDYLEDEPQFELYNLDDDPDEQVNLAAVRPDLVDELREAYDAWFDDVGSTRPDNYSKLRIGVGTPHESPTVLTRQEWRQTQQDNWVHPEANGFWDLDVRSAGTYGVEVRFPPEYDGGHVVLFVNGRRYAADATPGARSQFFDRVDMPKGPVRAFAVLDAGTSRAGAWQISLNRSGDMEVAK